MLCSAMLCAVIFYCPSFAFMLSRRLSSLPSLEYLMLSFFFRHLSSVFKSAISVSPQTPPYDVLKPAIGHNVIFLIPISSPWIQSEGTKRAPLESWKATTGTTCLEAASPQISDPQTQIPNDSTVNVGLDLSHAKPL
ncbi:hypothetical protein EV702DRAFT_1107706 [Suillus placidus]|uniref:Uncharacterized protein n=1 Tax=Suillus placidus TaxID=48579 RepID=A0A9P6ZTY2_9AGAM|nr:hypothetical protein EV702DRAFT_1107706 [Suillus placidus]